MWLILSFVVTQKTQPIDGWVLRGDVVDSYAADGGRGYGSGGDSATINDSASLHPSEFTSDCRKS
jgi:hypothetical protein